MMKIIIKDPTQKECEALGKMFMHLAGHELVVHDGPAPCVNTVAECVPPSVPSVPIIEEEFTVPPPPPLPVIQIEDVVAPNCDNSMTVMDTNVEIDSAGVIWDSTIHAKTKTKTVSGLWKKSKTRIVPTQILDKPPMFVPPPLPIIPVPKPVILPPPPIPLTVMPTASDVDLFDVLLNRVTAGMAAKKLTIMQVNQIIRSFKDEKGESIIVNLAHAGNRPDLIPLIMAELDKVEA